MFSPPRPADQVGGASRRHNRDELDAPARHQRGQFQRQPRARDDGGDRFFVRGLDEVVIVRQGAHDVDRDRVGRQRLGLLQHVAQADVRPGRIGEGAIGPFFPRAHGGDDAEGALIRDRGREPRSRDAHAHAALDDGRVDAEIADATSPARRCRSSSIVLRRTAELSRNRRRRVGSGRPRPRPL